jgi:hypothetical protein
MTGIYGPSYGYRLPYRFGVVTAVTVFGRLTAHTGEYPPSLHLSTNLTWLPGWDDCLNFGLEWLVYLDICTHIQML